MPLLNAQGLPLRRPRVGPTQIVGVSGTAVHGGIPHTGEKNANLLGQRRYTTYSDILANTSIVASCVRFFLNLVGRATWTVNPPDDTPEAKGYAERVEEMLMDAPATPWRRIVRRSATFVFYGFSIQEWAMRRTPEGMLYRDIAPRPQRTITRWAVLETGEVVGAWQTSPHTGREIFLPREKIVYLVDDSLNDSPEGLGLFRHVVDSAERLSKFQGLEAMGYETGLGGIPIGRAPLDMLDDAVEAGEITAADREKQIDVLRTFLKNPVRTPERSLILSSAVRARADESEAPTEKYLWGIEPLEGDVSGEEAIFKAIERINREIARVFGAEQLLLGGDGRGSFALSEQKAIQMYLIIEAALAEIAESYMDDLVAPLWQLNGWPENMMPELQPQTPSFHDIEQVAAILRDMATAGAMLLPNDPVVREIYGQLGLPFEDRAPEEEDEGMSLLGGGEDPDDGELPPPRGGNGDGRRSGRAAA